MSQLAHSYRQFDDAGIALLMVSVDSLRRARQLTDQAQPAFPVLSDRDVDAAVAFDVFEDGIALACTFVIDRQGIVRWSDIGQKPSDRPTPEQMLQHALPLAASPDA